MLPTRLFVAELDPETSAQLDGAGGALPGAPAGPAALDQLRPAFLRLFERVTHGIYPVRDGALQFDEFTAIYPVGTFNQYTSVHGRQIPEYPTPGRRALTTHQRTQTIDHVPTDEIYSYFPWLPYMHVGTALAQRRAHPLLEDEARRDALPAARVARGERGSRDGEPYEYLWLLSRGPMSHGCTHLNAGHISELRQMLPAETDQLYAVDLFYNTSRALRRLRHRRRPRARGDGRALLHRLLAEGQQTRSPARPQRASRLLRLALRRRARVRRGGPWVFSTASATLASSAGRPSKAPRTNASPLHEADYEPEKIQFYRLVDIPFAKELRKVGVHHPFPGLDTTSVGTK